jgi:hypothetical protein
MAKPRINGWIVISSLLLMLAGFNVLFNGLWALHANRAVESSVRGRLLFEDTNLDTWGWIYTVVGAVVVVASFAVFAGASWARYVGVLAAFFVMLVSFFWLFTPYWPAAFVSIVLAGVVVYGLGTYGEPTEWRNPWVRDQEAPRP